MRKNGTPASPATARAISVLPVPGGPTRSTPRGIRAPSELNFSGYFRNSTTSWSSVFASSTPATSANVTTVLLPRNMRARLLPKRERLVVRALGLPHHEEEEAADQQDGQQRPDQEVDPLPGVRRGHRREHDLVGVLAAGLRRVQRVLERALDADPRHDGRVLGRGVARGRHGEGQVLLGDLRDGPGPNVGEVRGIGLRRAAGGRHEERVEQRHRAHHEDEHHDAVAEELAVQPGLRVSRAGGAPPTSGLEYSRPPSEPPRRCPEAPRMVRRGHARPRPGRARNRQGRPGGPAVRAAVQW